MDSLQELLWLNEKGRLITGADPKPRPDFASCCRNLEREFNSIVAGFSFAAPREELFHQLTAVYNRAALMEYHLGECGRAEGLCHKAIAICAEEEHPKSKLWMLAILQPYVNLARVAAAKGNWSQAREILDRIFDFTERGESLWLNGCVLHESKKPDRQEERREIQDFGRSVFLADSLRALLIADRHHQLLSFTETWLENNLASNREFWMMLTESRARGLLALGQHRDALALLREMLERMKTWGRAYPAIYCLLAEVYSHHGDSSVAQDLLVRADQAYARALEQSNRHSSAVNFLCLLALSQISHKLYERARMNARAAIDLAERLQDEGSKLKAMALWSYSSSLSEELATGVDGGRHGEFCNLLLNTHYRLERVIGCCIAAHCSGGHSEYAEFENGGRRWLEHALRLCGQAPYGLFKEAAQLVRTIPMNKFAPDDPELTRFDQFSLATISDVYDRLIAFTPPQNAPALKKTVSFAQKLA